MQGLWNATHWSCKWHCAMPAWGPTWGWPPKHRGQPRQSPRATPSRRASAPPSSVPFARRTIIINWRLPETNPGCHAPNKAVVFAHGDHRVHLSALRALRRARPGGAALLTGPPRDGDRWVLRRVPRAVGRRRASARAQPADVRDHQVALRDLIHAAKACATSPS